LPRQQEPQGQSLRHDPVELGAGGGPLARFRQGRPWGRPAAQTGLESTGVEDAEIKYDEHGLVPCVVQDWNTGEVLTVAYVNQEALERTRATGQMHFFSRSRQELWHKGATSGNTMEVREIRYDCDGDALLALVEPAGPACHTGERTCFHNGELEPPAPHEVLPGLERTIAQRSRERPDGSYTASLLDDPHLVSAKVTEEAEEVVRAADN